VTDVLADVNVWLATLVEQHPHHEPAVRWWREEILPEDRRVVFCRMTQLGLLRLLCNESVMGRQRKTSEEAWRIYDQVLSTRPVVFADEPAGTEERLAEYGRGGGSSGGFWSDAYLAAFARSAGLGFATFDRGFRRYEGLALTLLR